MATFDVLVNTEWQQPLFNTVESIRKDRNFPLKNNYSTIDLSHFYAFHIEEDRGQIVAFSALEKDHRNRFPDNTARIGAKLWHNPAIRRKHGGHYHTFSFYSARNFVPKQVALAKQLGLNAVFASRNYPNKRYVFKHYLQQIDKCIAERAEFLEPVFNMCGSIDVPLCWQMIGLIRLSDQYTTEQFMSQMWSVPYDYWKQLQ